MYSGSIYPSIRASWVKLQSLEMAYYFSSIALLFQVFTLICKIIAFFLVK